MTTETGYSLCNFCPSLCNIQVTTRTRQGDKRIVKLEGNPHSTLNRGKICARGQAGLRQTYDVDRLKTPLIRIEGSKRGEFRFRPASWMERSTEESRIMGWACGYTPIGDSPVGVCC